MRLQVIKVGWMSHRGRATNKPSNAFSTDSHVEQTRTTYPWADLVRLVLFVLELIFNNQMEEQPH